MSKKHKNRAGEIRRNDEKKENEMDKNLTKFQKEREQLRFDEEIKKAFQYLINDKRDTDIIRKIENENIIVLTGARGDVCVCGSHVSTKSIRLKSADGQLLLEYGTNKNRDIVFVRIHMLPPCGYEIIGNGLESERTVLTFAGKAALDEAIATFKGLAMFFELEKLEAEKKAPKPILYMADQEAKNEV